MKNGDAGQTQNLTSNALSFGISPSAIIKQVLEPTMQEIGEKFKKDEVFIPDVLMSSRAMHASLYVLKPLISRPIISGRGKVVLGTVAGDLHDIGKNMVGMMLEGGGYEVIDIGIDVPVSEFVSAVKKNKPGILGISAALTTTMGKIYEVINEIEEKNLRHNLTIIVGGAPVSAVYAQKAGADGYCADGCKVVSLLDSLMHTRKNFRKVYR
ncbi:methyltransferase [Candidatus Formimonas warabiya]|uniref:Methyltransferase n=2 Tax=Formimonas warabiya TaxID=1761012 RepID=A0A3G1L1Q9_FORW1|nr:methyltransferase [Candidatus Formimonas warabiya]